jgi:putative flippase GtrA
MRDLSGSAWRFAVVGVINTLLTIAVIFGLKRFAGVGDVPANLSGYVVGLACSFVINSRWSFAFRGQWIAALLRFVCVFAVAYLLNLALVVGAIRAGYRSVPGASGRHAGVYGAFLPGLPAVRVWRTGRPCRGAT